MHNNDNKVINAIIDYFVHIEPKEFMAQAYAAYPSRTQKERLCILLEKEIADQRAVTKTSDETITAAVSLVNEDGEAVEFLANGQGSVEAIFNAIDKFFNQTVRLISYNIDAITDGIDAQARVLVSVENVDTDTIFNASGLDFDVLKASAIAYINANTLVQKENAGEMARKVSYRDLPQT